MSFIYKGLEATYDRHLVTDAEVDQQMERLRQQTPNIKAITDRAAQLGDTVVLDYAGFCDGVQFDGGTAEKQELTLGSGMFIPGFEEQLVGSRPGEAVTVQVTFPEQYHSADLAGKAAEFRCTVHEIFERSTYELDDAFAQAIGIPTLEQMRAELHKSLQSYIDERGQMDLEDRLIRKAAQTLEFSPTDEELEKALDEQMNALSAQLGQQGLSLEMYAQFTGKTVDELREDNRGDARENLRIRTAIEKIVELEEIPVSEDEMMASIADIAKQNKLTPEQMQPYMSKEFLAAVKGSIEMKKAMRLVRENANIINK